MSARSILPAATLSLETEATVRDWLAVLQKAPDDNVQSSTDAAITITALVDGRTLACPMPLLKTKVALRQVAVGDSVYVLATDPNSRADMVAFCAQTPDVRLQVNAQTNTADTGSNTASATDTIFHFIITKTDSK
ncbi:sulfurtransferase TusA family protein [Psychrobacter aestuarii]|uniref:UPF0033 domain-containing protein n=1 Tax=Psychrobacter aestuarii TaxID=556327 RepID=A0ABP3F9R0_9GAMM|nr:sulfurtransferase TusA family protein [Psychrobacter aestuarii]